MRLQKEDSDQSEKGVVVMKNLLSDQLLVKGRTGENQKELQVPKAIVRESDALETHRMRTHSPSRTY